MCKRITSYFADCFKKKTKIYKELTKKNASLNLEKK